MKPKLKINIIVPIVFIVLGLYWAYMGFTRYTFWADITGPGSGFLVAVVGIAFAIVNIVDLLQQRGVKDDITYDKEGWIMLGILGAIVVCAYLIGLIPALFLFLLLWFKLYAKYGWIKTILFSAAEVIIAYLIFNIWMDIPAEWGVVGNWLGL